MDELVLGSGELGTSEEQKDAMRNVGLVWNDINNIKKSFVKLGFHLDEMNRWKIHKVFGFEDFYEFCECNFKLSSSTVKRHIQIWNRFCERDKYGLGKMFIDDKHENYSYSQLCEMLPLDDEKASKIKPEMTIKEIREYKAGLKMKKCDVAPEELEQTGCDVAPEESEHEGIAIVDMINCKLECLITDIQNKEINFAYARVLEIKKLLETMLSC